MTTQTEVLIASGILGSTCVVLIIISIWYAIWRRHGSHQDGYAPLVPEIPPYAPDIKQLLIQPHLYEQEKYGVDIEKYFDDSSPKVEVESIPRPIRSPLFQPPTIEFPMNEKSEPTKSVSEEFEHCYEQKSKVISSNKGLYTPNISISTGEGLNQKHRYNEKFDRKTHPLSKCISIEAMNTPVCSPKIPRNRKPRVETLRKHKSKKKTPLVRSYTAPSAKEFASPTTSSSSESFLDSPFLKNEILFEGESVLSESSSLGNILVSLCHNPSEGKLSITIKSTKDLPLEKKSKKVDPFIKIRVYDRGKKLYKKGTPIKQGPTQDCEESFDFVVTTSKMPQTSVILWVYHHWRRAHFLNKSILIGVVFLGYQFELFGPHQYMLEKGGTHWARVTENPYLPIEEWHPIQAFSSE